MFVSYVTHAYCVVGDMTFAIYCTGTCNSMFQFTSSNIHAVQIFTACSTSTRSARGSITIHVWWLWISVDCLHTLYAWIAKSHWSIVISVLWRGLNCLESCTTLLYNYAYGSQCAIMLLLLSWNWFFQSVYHFTSPY